MMNVDVDDHDDDGDDDSSNRCCNGKKDNENKRWTTVKTTVKNIGDHDYTSGWGGGIGCCSNGIWYE